MTWSGNELVFGAGDRSATRAVPAAVPSLRCSWWPITFRLNRTGRRLLRRSGGFDALMRVRIARRGDQPRAQFTPLRVPERTRR